MKKLILLTFLLINIALATQNTKNDSQRSDREVLEFLSNCHLSALQSNASATGLQIVKYCQCSVDYYMKFEKENPNKDLGPKELRKIAFSCIEQTGYNQ